MDVLLRACDRFSYRPSNFVVGARKKIWVKDASDRYAAYDYLANTSVDKHLAKGYLKNLKFKRLNVNDVERRTL